MTQGAGELPKSSFINLLRRAFALLKPETGNRRPSLVQRCHASGSCRTLSRPLCGVRVKPPRLYPFGPLYRLLLLTGARKGELAGARWRELDLGKKIWRVPPERFKSNANCHLFVGRELPSEEQRLVGLGRPDGLCLA
jgi:integrase